MKKIVALLVLSLCLMGCKAEKPERIVQTRSTDPINSTQSLVPPNTQIYTSVYVTIFQDTAYLSTYPLEKMGELEPECAPRNIAKGGTILCDCDHPKDITRVVIVEQLCPNSTANWFRNMGTLRTVDGLGYLKVEQVTDMSNMFSGCTNLVNLDLESWAPGADVDTTGMFDGCDAFGRLPSWY